MNGASAALIVILVCLAGAAAAVTASRSKAPWWVIGLLGSVAFGIALLVITAYMRA